MARYTGPTSRIARRFGEPIFGPDKVLAKKSYAPGQHGSIEEEEKNQNMVSNLMKNKKLNLPMVF